MWCLVDLELKGCESYIHNHDIDFSVTMVEWLDVPDGDRGDFMHRHAVYISSFTYFKKCENIVDCVCVIHTVTL